MKTALKWLGYVLGGLVAVLLVGFAIGAWVYRDIPAETLLAKYGNTESKFVTLDGARIHFRDEGVKDGPAVVLLHAHYDSLLSWDPWVAALKDKYRVVRFDMTSHGLTGADPSGDYTLERTVKITEMMVDSLGLTKISMAGTSMGGTIAIHYAVRHPDRVERMILLSPGALNTRVRGSNTPPPLPPGTDLLAYITPRALIRGLLSSGFGDKSKLSDQLIDQWWELMRLEGQREAEITRMRQYISGDIDAKIKTVTAPVLVMWGEANPVVTVDQADQFTKLLESSPSVKLITYPGVGHMAVHEAPDKTSADARAFFDGI